MMRENDLHVCNLCRVSELEEEEEDYKQTNNAQSTNARTNNERHELHSLLADTVFRRLAVCDARTGASQRDEKPLWGCRVSVRRDC